MIRTALVSRSAARLSAVTFATAMAVTAFTAAHADPGLPASASAVRNALIALSAADAATPLAVAYAASGATAAMLPPAMLTLKPDTANAMAAVRTVSARRSESAAYAERRALYRPYRDPFVLMVGVAY